MKHTLSTKPIIIILGALLCLLLPAFIVRAAPVIAPVTLTITAVNNTDGRLTWSDPAPGCTAELYEDTDAYFTVGGNRLDNNPRTPYSLPGRLTDVTTNYYYLIQTDCNGSTTDSNRVGAFTFSMDGSICKATSTNNLPATAATYLGGNGDDSITGIGVSAAGDAIWLAAQLPGQNLGLTPTTLLSGGDGALVKLSPGGTTAESITRLGNQINDLEISADGPMVTCGDFGMAHLPASGDALTWHRAIGTVDRCAIGSAGTTAGVVNDHISVYSAGNLLLGEWDVGGTNTYDIAVDDAHGLVFATGYTQATSNLQIAFLKAWQTDGTAAWTAYGFSASAVQNENLGADTRGRVVSIGADGMLYFAGTSSGGTGASIFSRDPHNVADSLQSDRYITPDQYHNPSNVGDKTLTWYGRYHPADGELLGGQPLLTRLSSGSGNSIAPRAITGDETGRIYVSGEAFASMANRNNLQIAGQNVGGYSGGEPFALIVQPDFQQRIVWTSFAGTTGAGSSPAPAIAVGDGIAAVGVTLNAGGSLITHNALQPSLGGGREAYAAVWPQICE